MHYQTPTNYKGHARGNAFQVPTREKQSLYNITLDKFLIVNLETYGDTTTSYINILFVVKIGFESLKYTTLLIELLETT